MFNWLKTQRLRRAIQESRREACEASPKRPSQPMMSAMKETSSALGLSLSGGPLRRLRGRIILILARQLADANERLNSSYWTGPDGHNVGQDALQAYGVALEVVRKAGSLPDLIESLTVQSAAYRGRAGDPDGYGSATLGEIERDLRNLAAQMASGGS